MALTAANAVQHGCFYQMDQGSESCMYGIVERASRKQCTLLVGNSDSRRLLHWQSGIRLARSWQYVNWRIWLRIRCFGFPQKPPQLICPSARMAQSAYQHRQLFCPALAGQLANKQTSIPVLSLGKENMIASVANLTTTITLRVLSAQVLQSLPAKSAYCQRPMAGSECARVVYRRKRGGGRGSMQRSMILSLHQGESCWSVMRMSCMSPVPTARWSSSAGNTMTLLTKISSRTTPCFYETARGKNERSPRYRRRWAHHKSYRSQNWRSNSSPSNSACAGDWKFNSR